VVIVGGGSAGWLSAGVIAAAHTPGAGFEVTLIESPGIPPVGVGEGTWPSMRDTLRRIGVSETDFIRECDVSFKQGSKFVGWASGADTEHYYHPFSLPQGYVETDLVGPWLRRHASTPFADLVSFQPQLCERGRAPKQVTTPEFAGVANYAYHLDAGKFGQFLQRHCTARLGVRHVLDQVGGVESAANGDIAGLQTANHGRIDGDLFVDCTGFAARLLGQHYQVGLRSVQHVLFNDCALALQIPYADAGAEIASHTISTARSAGWIWDIGLQGRRGVGYVYSSAHTSDADAERTLLAYAARGADASATAMPALLFFVLLITVPESPRWLLGNGREQRARAVLTALHGPLAAHDELAEIQGSLAAHSPISRIYSVFDRRLRFVLLFALGIALLQQITGINAVLYYLPTIFAQAGGSLASAFRQSVLVGLVNVGMTLVAIRLVDRLGRRPLLIAGVAGMAAALLTISWAFYAGYAPLGAIPPANARMLLLAIIAFVASFAISLGPVMWVLLAEIFPNEQRAAAISLVGFWNSLVSAGVTFIFPWELSTFGPAGTFLGYGLLALAGLLFLAILAPETKGRTLEELENMLQRPAQAAA
jgi:MFS family permease